MLRAILELLLTIAVILIARAVLSGIMRGIASTSYTAFQNGNPQAEQGRPGSQPQQPPTAGLLHKDPVCGTFVAESTPFQRNIGQERFFYCSEACLRKHSLASR